MMPVETLQLALAAEDLLLDWGLKEDDCVIAQGTLGFFEHCIHELAHAQSLGLEFNEQASSKIGELLAISGPDTFKPFCKALAEEARAWAIEWHVWQTLKVPLQWGDLVAGADIQGVEEETVKALLDEPDIRLLAERVVKGLKGISDDLDSATASGCTNQRWGRVTSGKDPYWVFRHDDEAKGITKAMTNEELMKLAAFHIRDFGGDPFLTEELLNRVNRR